MNKINRKDYGQIFQEAIIMFAYFMASFGFYFILNITFVYNFISNDFGFLMAIITAPIFAAIDLYVVKKFNVDYIRIVIIKYALVFASLYVFDPTAYHEIQK